MGRARDHRLWSFPARLPVLVALAALIVYPMVRLGFEADGGSVFEADVGRAAFNSVWTSAAAASLAAGAGAAFALLTERTAMQGTRFLRAALVGTLIVPPFVSALSWQATYGPFGLLDDAAGLAASWISGKVGVVLVITVNVVPLPYLIVAASLRSSRVASLEWAARAAGSGPAETMRRITLPLVRPAILGGWLVAFASALSSFGVPVVLGTPAGFETLTTRVYRAVAFSALPEAFDEAVMMALLLAVIAFAVVVVADRYRPGSLAPGASGPAPYLHPVGPGLAAGAWFYIAASVLVPALGLVLRALTRAVGMSATPDNWTLVNFAEAVNGRTWEALGRSAVLAVLAAVAALGLAALLVGLERTAGRRWGSVALVMFAVPGTSIALAMSLAYGRWIANTMAIILLAYVAKLLALAHRPLSAAAAGVHPDLARAGRASGAGPLTNARLLLVPLLRPALLAGAVLVFVFGIHELTMSSILHGPGNETLAVVILDFQQIGDPTTTAALAVVLAIAVGLAALPLLYLRRIWHGST
jgi:iron(III) transport system permease protein